VNYLSKTLLGSAAICALATAPAMAAGSHPSLSITAAHAGKVINKTAQHDPKAQKLTYTFGVSTYVPPSDAGTSVHLFATYYKWNSNLTICSNPKQKIKITKNPTNGTAGTANETYSFGCASGPTVFHGDTYDYGGSGSSDSLVSKLTGKYKNSGVKYKGTLNLDVSIIL
jgi:hypothetical protein